MENEHEESQQWLDEKDIEREKLRYFMALSVEEKLTYLEALNGFLFEAMTKESKDIWEVLKARGY